jgi:3-oxoacyl-[acyl-carrier protein] reductase
VQRRERQLQLGLHAGELSDATARGLPRAVVQQRGLADPGLTTDDQHRALAATHPVKQTIECLALAGTPPKGRRSWCGHPVTVEPGIGAREHPGARSADAGQARAMTSPLNGTSAGRVAIVTGGSRGIGRATTGRLASRGYAVVVNYLHDQRAVESAVEEVLADHGAAVAVRADVVDELDVQRLFAETIEAFGGVDVVVHTVASRTAATPIAEIDLEQFDAWCRINIRATLIVNREAARWLRHGGAIVNLSSSTAGSPLPTYGACAATTAAANALTRVLALELRERDISVNTVSLALDRPCAPHRIADAIAHLLTDQGHRRTGRVIHIDEIDDPRLPPAHR